MRLIDADALKTKAETIQTIDCWHMRTEEQAVLVEHIDNAPTIDAVPVVRCKDCVHYRVYQLASDGETITDCAVMPCHPPENWYCSNAERKDDE